MENSWCCDDILIDILSRISSVKELSRFKCVCKSWNLLIDQVCIPSTVTAFYIPTLPLSRTNENCQPLAKINLDEYTYLFKDGHDRDDCIEAKIRSDGYRLVDCCNGLLLFVKISSSKSRRLWSYQYYVFNPTIKQWFDIPEGLPSCESVFTVFAALAFDPSKSPHYKIVQFSVDYSHPIILDIYSSQTHQWVRPELHVDNVTIIGIWWSCTSVYLNGVLYILSDARHLLRIDIDLLKASKVPGPGGNRNDKVACIGLHMGRLSCAECAHGSNKFFIWSLEQDDGTLHGHRWVLSYNICIRELRWHVLFNMQHPPSLYWFEPFAFGPNTDVIYFGTPYMIISYHLKTKRIEEVFRTADNMTCHSPVLVVTK